MRSLILYGLASGFNRGGMFLILPLLASFMSIADYGKFSLYIVIVQLLIPFISINVASIIGREIYEKFKVTLFFTVAFNRIAVLVIFSCVFAYFFTAQIVFLIVIYAFLEAVFLLNSTFVRFKSSANNYFYLCISKMVLLVALLLFSYFYNVKILSEISWLVIIFAFSNVVIIIPFWRLTYSLKVSITKLITTISTQKAIIFFALGILPHTLAQWVTSGSDRFFVKYFDDGIQLGYYSFAYAVAAIYMVVNSALALGIPQICVQNFQRFTARKFYIIYLITVSILWLLFFLMINIALCYLDLKYKIEDIFWVIYFVLVGMYFLSFYYYYSSFLFYDRKSKQLSTITIITAIINVSLVISLTPLLGIEGTALSTAISYYIYAFITYHKVARNHVVIGLVWPTMIMITMTIMVVAFVTQTNFLN